MLWWPSIQGKNTWGSRRIVQVCSLIVLKCPYLARTGRPDILWSVNKLCHVANTAQQCRLALFQDSDFAGGLAGSKSTSGGMLCIFGSHTFVPTSWMCKMQTSVSQRSFGSCCECRETCCERLKWGRCIEFSNVAIRCKFELKCRETCCHRKDSESHWQRLAKQFWDIRLSGRALFGKSTRTCGRKLVASQETACSISMWTRWYAENVYVCDDGCSRSSWSELPTQRIYIPPETRKKEGKIKQLFDVSRKLISNQQENLREIYD